METRRLLLAALLSMAVLLVWQKLFPPPPVVAPESQSAPQELGDAATPSAPVAAPMPAVETPAEREAAGSVDSAPALPPVAAVVRRDGRARRRAHTRGLEQSRRAAREFGAEGASDRRRRVGRSRPASLEWRLSLRPGRRERRRRAVERCALRGRAGVRRRDVQLSRPRRRGAQEGDPGSRRHPGGRGRGGGRLEVDARPRCASDLGGGGREPLRDSRRRLHAKRRGRAVGRDEDR